ncbi:MAG: DUF4190 domain-containing protein [Bellilinea sp.]
MSDEYTLPPILEPEILPKAAPESDRSWAGTTSFILGLINLVAWCLPFCGGPLAIIGVILGVLGLKAPNRRLSIAGIVLNAIGLLLSIVFTIVFFSLWSSGWFQNFDFNQFYYQ